MISCVNCEHYKDDELTCDPARNIKEEACLLKWMFIKLVNIERFHAAYDGMAPRTGKSMQHAEHEVDEQQRAESWRTGAPDDEGD